MLWCIARSVEFSQQLAQRTLARPSEHRLRLSLRDRWSNLMNADQIAADGQFQDLDLPQREADLSGYFMKVFR